MKKLGFVILFLAFPISYYLIHFLKFESIGNYTFTFMFCIGVGILAYVQSNLEKNKVLKYLFYRAISFFHGLIVLMYLIDFIVDPFFKTGKVIWSIFITTFISLCIYLFKHRNH